MVETKQIIEKGEWDAFLQTHDEANFLQSWEWGEFHEKLGNPIERIGFYENNIFVGVMLLVVEPARRGRYITVPGLSLIHI